MHCQLPSICGYGRPHCIYEQNQDNCGGVENFVAKVEQLGVDQPVAHTCCRLSEPIATHLENDCFIYELPDGTTTAAGSEEEKLEEKSQKSNLTVVRSLDELSKEFTGDAKNQDAGSKTFQFHFYSLTEKSPPVLLVKAIQRYSLGYRVTICRARCLNRASEAEADSLAAAAWRGFEWGRWSKKLWQKMVVATNHIEIKANEKSGPANSTDAESSGKSASEAWSDGGKGTVEEDGSGTQADGSTTKPLKPEKPEKRNDRHPPFPPIDGDTPSKNSEASQAKIPRTPNSVAKFDEPEVEAKPAKANIDELSRENLEKSSAASAESGNQVPPERLEVPRNSSEASEESENEVSSVEVKTEASEEKLGYRDSAEPDDTGDSESIPEAEGLSEEDDVKTDDADSEVKIASPVPPEASEEGEGAGGAGEAASDENSEAGGDSEDVEDDETDPEKSEKLRPAGKNEVVEAPGAPKATGTSYATGASRATEATGVPKANETSEAPEVPAQLKPDPRNLIDRKSGNVGSSTTQKPKNPADLGPDPENSSGKVTGTKPEATKKSLSDILKPVRPSGKQKLDVNPESGHLPSNGDKILRPSDEDPPLAPNDGAGNGKTGRAAPNATSSRPSEKTTVNPSNSSSSTPEPRIKGSVKPDQARKMKDEAQENPSKPLNPAKPTGSELPTAANNGSPEAVPDRKLAPNVPEGNPDPSGGQKLTGDRTVADPEGKLIPENPQKPDPADPEGGRLPIIDPSDPKTDYKGEKSVPEGDTETRARPGPGGLQGSGKPLEPLPENLKSGLFSKNDKSKRNRNDPEPSGSINGTKNEAPETHPVDVVSGHSKNVHKPIIERRGWLPDIQGNSKRLPGEGTVDGAHDRKEKGGGEAHGNLGQAKAMGSELDPKHEKRAAEKITVDLGTNGTLQNSKNPGIPDSGNAMKPSKIEKTDKTDLLGSGNLSGNAKNDKNWINHDREAGGSGKGTGSSSENGTHGAGTKAENGQNGIKNEIGVSNKDSYEDLGSKEKDYGIDDGTEDEGEKVPGDPEEDPDTVESRHQNSTKADKMDSGEDFSVENAFDDKGRPSLALLEGDLDGANDPPEALDYGEDASHHVANAAPIQKEAVRPVQLPDVPPDPEAIANRNYVREDARFDANTRIIDAQEAQAEADEKAAAAQRARRNCFSGDLLVPTPYGNRRMDELQIGDRILVPIAPGVSQFEMIEMFYHRDPEKETMFLKIKTRERSISVTPKHLIPAGNCGDLNETLTTEGDVQKLLRSSIFARNLKPGMCLVTVDDYGQLVLQEIHEISRQYSRGIYAPVTVSGSIVANGILASCFAEVESHTMQKLLYDFVSMVYRYFGMSGFSTDHIPIPALLDVLQYLGQLTVPFIHP
ncbi:unnamed protein product, partial [Mesorhabditis spiculigera]